MDTFQEHVLLPHLPDWTQRVEWTRTWQTGIADAVDGSEERVALRPQGRHRLRYVISPGALGERALLLARLRQALKTGLVAVPFWGRGLRLVEAWAGSNTVTLAAATSWRFLPGDPVYFGSLDADAFDHGEIRPLTKIEGTTLTVDGVLTRSHVGFCWPMLLGRLDVGDLDVRTDWHLQVPVEVRQLQTRDDPDSPGTGGDACALALTGSGAGESFDCYAVANPLTATLNRGNGWAGAWAWEPFPLGVIAFESFATYPPEDPLVQALDGGDDWASPWTWEP